MRKTTDLFKNVQHVILQVRASLILYFVFMEKKNKDKFSLFKFELIYYIK